ncbi:glycosyltransferase family 4 protein [Microbulbifer sp. TRSA005]|uniref:glycosyltransferase family 4 protein n=1 Tax=Microbulbifer sp. TRSA005 TaxID=3243383 RepID=UPI004039F002
MHILIPVYFMAPLGGLHSHVYAQARAIVNEGWRCTILCKPGPFAQQCRSNGIEVIEDDFRSPFASADRIAETFDFDLIHTHPFASREIGQRIAKILNIPIILTIHGKYTDSLEDDCEDFSRIYCVSLGVRDHLVKKRVENLHKILVYPNAVNTDVFYCDHISREDKVGLLRNLISSPIRKDDRIIVFTCRMGPDKKFIIKCVIDAWKDQGKKELDSWQWIVAGDGSERDELISAANTLNKILDRQCITFLGWQSEDKLNTLYQSADLVIAPGRSALDCMGSSKPVIAIGSKGYIGIIDEENWYRGAYSNFGGVGEKDYISGKLFQDINTIINDDERLAAIGRFGRKQILSFYNQKYWNNWLLNQYREVVTLHKKVIPHLSESKKDLISLDV